MNRPFRFGVIAAHADTADSWRTTARRAEELGYATLLVPDHIAGQLAPVPAMVAAADATSRLRVGSFVFSNDFRNPVLLAKELATLDLLSDGRLEIGIGAGYMATDYEALGLSIDPASVRVARMMEAVRLLKRLLADDEVVHEGKHYEVRARLQPRPVQRPHPPIMIGGGGPRMLEFAAHEAEIVGLVEQLDASGVPKPGSLTADGVERQVAKLRAAAGSRFASLELNVRVKAAALTNVSSAAERIPSRYRSALPQALETPYFLFGTGSEIVARLRAQRERLSISYLAVPQAVMDEFAPVVAELAGT